MSKPNYDPSALSNTPNRNIRATRRGRAAAAGLAALALGWGLGVDQKAGGEVAKVVGNTAGLFDIGAVTIPYDKLSGLRYTKVTVNPGNGESNIVARAGEGRINDDNGTLAGEMDRYIDSQVPGGELHPGEVVKVPEVKPADR